MILFAFPCIWTTNNLLRLIKDVEDQGRDTFLGGINELKNMTKFKHTSMSKSTIMVKEKMKHFDRIWVNGHETIYSFESRWIWMSVCFLFELTPNEFPNFPLVSENKKLKIQLYILHRFDRQPWLSLHTLSLSQASCVLLRGMISLFQLLDLWTILWIAPKEWYL